ncbi:hypothetical protein [Flavonifractor sp. An92]|uniref:hypothetical protein n=1 Tax=Flavonifractor sp. An92 TaxID=1965666 RepID=UPI00130291CC|nr:hypothetical protein [Flavonifractor sp. An92]
MRSKTLLPGGFTPPEQMKEMGSPRSVRTGGIAYKKNMYALLGKPGYEEHRAALEARL